ncbi:MAG: restriction endonuclease subunit S [Planctomycetota bacterium]
MRNGWQTKSLGDICAFENGDRGENYPSRSIQTTEGVPFINAGHLTDDGIGISSLNYIPRERFDLLGNGKIRSGDILFCLRGSLGKFASVGGLSEGAIASSLVIVRPGDTVLNDFILAYFESHLCAEMISQYKNGAAQPNLSAGSLRKFVVPVPPLPEQRRIVGILDEAFAGIATAKATAEKNLQNARALFESHLQAVFTQRGEGWVEKRLGDIADFKNGLNFNQSSKGQSVRVVGVGDFGRNYLVPLQELQSVTIDDELDESYEIREHDILTVRSNGSKDLVGRCMLVPAINEVISYSGFVIRIRPVLSVVVPRLLLHFMKCSATRERLTREGGGTNISNINQAKLSTLSVSLPPLSSQPGLVDQLDRMLHETQRLASHYQRKLAALDELKNSLLHRAFSGEL